jgi:hypothetical protein
LGQSGSKKQGAKWGFLALSAGLSGDVDFAGNARSAQFTCIFYDVRIDTGGGDFYSGSPQSRLKLLL